jgi:hypothetical protein
LFKVLGIELKASTTELHPQSHVPVLTLGGREKEKEGREKEEREREKKFFLPLSFVLLRNGLDEAHLLGRAIG